MSGWPELSIEWYREQYAHNPIGMGVWAAKLWEHYIDLEARLEAMNNAATIAVVALAAYDTSDDGLDDVRDMLEKAMTTVQQEQEA